MKYSKPLPIYHGGLDQPLPEGWDSTLNVLAYNLDNPETVDFTIRKIVDPDGEVTPFDWQLDFRSPSVFPSGFAIRGTDKVFKTWAKLAKYWNRSIGQ